jgi:hypothetical protein
VTEKKAKPMRLTARWSRREKDVLYSWPAIVGGSSDGRWLNECLRRVCEEADARGFDLKTLRFSIDYKPETRARRRGDLP